MLLVTDIKTGGSGRYAVIKDDPVAAGTRLQLPVYAHAARQQLGADQVVAQYWFVRKDRFKRIPVDLNDTVEDLYSRTLDVLVRGIADGVFPAKAPEVQDFAWVQCPYCNPDGLGHSDARERWERKRGQPELAGFGGAHRSAPPLSARSAAIQTGRTNDRRPTDRCRRAGPDRAGHRSHPVRPGRRRVGQDPIADRRVVTLVMRGPGPAVRDRRRDIHREGRRRAP